MRKPGEMAPSWSATAADGTTVSDTTYRGRPLLLYFYPKAGTTGCTIETRQFVEHTPEFDRAGVAVVGVSVDTVEAQHRFADECHVAFPLVADVDKSIARAFGVLGLLGYAKRVTFWISPEGRIEDVFEGMMPGPHVQRALARLGAGAPPATAAGPH